MDGSRLMRNNRSGENGIIPPRSERVFQKHNYWYYTTREGVEIGPFDNSEAARKGAVEFVDFVLNAEPAVLEALSRYSSRAA